MIPEIPPRVNFTGTLGWTDTGLNSTTAVFNVTRDVTLSSDGLVTPSVHRTGSFSETVDLPSRIISIMPFLKTEMDNALQVDQSMVSTSVPSGVDPSTEMSAMESTIFQPHPVYTMWWINDASGLKLNQTVPVLFFQTNVTGSTSVDLGSLGTRQAWVLTFSPRPFPMPDSSTAGTGITSPIFSMIFTFNYDQKSGLLLSANVNVHFGFSEIVTQSGECSAVSNPPIAWCNTGSVILTRSGGFNLSATLTLASTNLNLDQMMGPSASSEGGTTSSTGSGSESGGNPGSGSGTGTVSGSGSNAGNNPSPSSSQPMISITPWIYLLLGLIIVAVIAMGLWISKLRSKNPATPPPQ